MFSGLTVGELVDYIILFAALIGAIYKIYDFDRPTVFKDGEQGLTNFLKQFFASELAVMPERIQSLIFDEVAELTRGTLWNGKEWVADYRRLRAIAHK